MATLPRRLLVGGLAGGAALLAVGGVAYAVGDGTDPSPDSGYVEVVDPSPSPSGSPSEQDRDCPEKDGSSRGDTTPDEPAPDSSGSL
jgi:hypothetical protein